MFSGRNINVKINLALLAKAGMVVAAVALFASLVFSLFYLFSSHQVLANWYLNLNGCLYKQHEFTTAFFSPAVKAQGNLFCAAAVLISLAGFFWLGRVFFRLRQWPQGPEVIRLPVVDVVLLSLGLVAGVGFWIWGNNLVGPAYDEVFSAVNVAELHPFQAMSYYMLPNNHLLFNLLNGTLFFFADDKIASGRWLSGFGYLLTLVLVYAWFRKLTASAPLALLAMLALGLQFPLWGFGFQARGYAGYALMHWVCFISLFQYLKSAETKWLVLVAAGSFIGFCLVPTFLFFQVALVAFALINQLRKHHADFRFWKWQVITAAAVVLFYVPALAFSGLSALADNRYVRPGNKTVLKFIPEFIADLGYYAEYAFSDVMLFGQHANKVLFWVPLLLLFAPRKSRWFNLGCFYFLMVAGVVVLAVLMKKSPFHRNLVGQFSIGLAILAATVYWLLAEVPKLLKQQVLQVNVALAGRVAFGLALVLLSVHLVRKNPQLVSNNLYFYDINPTFEQLNKAMQELPPNSSIGFSEEGFFPYYLARKYGHPMQLPCQLNKADYFIITEEEAGKNQVPDSYTQSGQFLHFQVYKRNGSGG